MVGQALPKDGLFEEYCTIYGFDFDKDGVIWSSAQGVKGTNPPYIYYSRSYLVRWDPDNGEDPYVCGLLGKPERIQAYVTEVEYDPKNDRLFWVDTVSGSKFRPSAGGVDLAQFRPVYRERGPISSDFRAYDRPMNAEEWERYEERQKKGPTSEENSADNPFQAWHPSKVEHTRIWMSLPRLEVEDSKVIGMAFDKKSKDYRWKLHVVSGRSGDFETAAFVMELVDGVVTKTQRFSEIDEKYKAWLRENILPQKPDLDESIKLPEATGRRYRAKASCVVDWNNDRKFVGTLDALAAIVNPDGSVFSLANSQLGGKLKGIYEMRDGNNGENFYGKVAGVNVDSAGTCTMTVATSADYLQDITKTTLPSNGGKIVIGNTEYHFSSWDYEKDADGNLTGNYIFTMTEIIPESRVTSDVKIGNSVDCQGIPYYMAQMNEWARTFASKFNEILADGYDMYGNSGNILFSANHETDKEQYLFENLFSTVDENGNKKNASLNMKDDSYYRLTAKNFSILNSMLDDPDLLATKVDAAAGVDEYGNVEKLIKMITDKSEVSFRGASCSEFLTCILSDIALNANNANNFHGNFDNVGKAIDNQRLSISGVDTDEEAVNLVKYQNAYTLASKMIQTLTEVYDRLILETGV